MIFAKYFCFLVLAFTCIVFVYVPAYPEEPQSESSIEKNKKEILDDIELFEHNILTTRSCVSQAVTAEELQKCRVDEARIKYEKVQDDLMEIGMTPEQRRMYELRPRR
jgi:uncharacterized protein YpmS